MYYTNDNSGRSVLILLILMIFIVITTLTWFYFSPTVPVGTENKTIHYSPGFGTSSYNIDYEIYRNESLSYNNTAQIENDSYTFERLNCGDGLNIIINSHKYPFPSSMVFSVSFYFEYRCNKDTADKLVRIR